MLIGSGIRMFNETGREIMLRLTSSRAYESGLVQLKYERD